MRYLYDLFARIIKKRKTAKLVYKFVSVFLYLALSALVTVLLVIRVKKVGFDPASLVYVILVIYLMTSLTDELFFKIRYLHVSHNKEIKSVLRGTGVRPYIKNPHGRDVFSCKFDNDAYIECIYEKNKYHFTVKNDEWDEVQTFESGENDFSEAFRSAVECASALVKEPEGEYDESLAEDEEYEAEEEYYEEDEEDETEDGDAPDDRE